MSFSMDPGAAAFTGPIISAAISAISAAMIAVYSARQAKLIKHATPTQDGQRGVGTVGVVVGIFAMIAGAVFATYKVLQITTPSSSVSTLTQIENAPQINALKDDLKRKSEEVDQLKLQMTSLETKLAAAIASSSSLPSNKDLPKAGPKRDSHSENANRLTPPPDTNSAPIIVESDGIRFQVAGCRAIGEVVRVELLLTSTDSDIDLFVDRCDSVVYADNGSRYKIYKVVLGNDTAVGSDCQAEVLLLKNRAVKGSFEIHDADPSANAIGRLVLRCKDNTRYTSGQDFEFRLSMSDIPIAR